MGWTTATEGKERKTWVVFPQLEGNQLLQRCTELQEQGHVLGIVLGTIKGMNSCCPTAEDPTARAAPFTSAEVLSAMLCLPACMETSAKAATCLAQDCHR
jgi:hypothetical protein